MQFNAIGPNERTAVLPLRTPPAPTGIPALTGIRGLAAAYVFLHHYQPLLAAFLKAPAINENLFLSNGFRGVDLFFILSGFIIMHVHSHDFDDLAGSRLSSFYILRFLRVYPLNAVVLLALLPIALGMPEVVAWERLDHGINQLYHQHDFSLAAFVQTLFLAQTWTVMKLGEWNAPSWSLSAEVVGYAFFPFAAHLLVRRRSPAACVMYAAASFAMLVALMVCGGHAHNNPTGSFGLIRLVFAFFAGMCLCRTFHLWQPRDQRVGSLITLTSVAFIGLALSFRMMSILTVVGFGGLIFGLAYRAGPVSALLESRVVIFMGKISFSFYLIHYMLLDLFLWLFETTISLRQAGLGVRITCLVAMPAVSLLLAVGMHRYLERPFQRLAHRLAGPRERSMGQMLRAA